MSLRVSVLEMFLFLAIAMAMSMAMENRSENCAEIACVCCVQALQVLCLLRVPNHPQSLGYDGLQSYMRNLSLLLHAWEVQNVSGVLEPMWYYFLLLLM